MAVPALNIPQCRFNIISFDTIEYTAKDDEENDVDMVIKTMAVSLEPYYNNNANNLSEILFSPWSNLRIETPDEMPTLDEIMERNTVKRPRMCLTLNNNILYSVFKTTKQDNPSIGLLTLLGVLTETPILIDVNDGNRTLVYKMEIPNISDHLNTVTVVNEMTFSFVLKN